MAPISALHSKRHFSTHRALATWNTPNSPHNHDDKFRFLLDSLYVKLPQYWTLREGNQPELRKKIRRKL